MYLATKKYAKWKWYCGIVNGTNNLHKLFFTAKSYLWLTTAHMHPQHTHKSVFFTPRSSTVSKAIRVDATCEEWLKHHAAAGWGQACCWLAGAPCALSYLGPLTESLDSMGIAPPKPQLIGFCCFILPANTTEAWVFNASEAGSSLGKRGNERRWMKRLGAQLSPTVKTKWDCVGLSLISAEQRGCNENVSGGCFHWLRLFPAI